MRLFAFAASHRKESVNRKLVKLAADMALAEGASIDLAEYGTFDMPIYDDETYNSQALPHALPKFVEHLQHSDGVIIATPEYNWSFPGSLKNIIDWASVITPNPFEGKTALLLSASPSLRGGAQGLIHLKVPFEALRVFVFPRIFTLARAADAFDVEGGLKDAKLGAELQEIVSGFVNTTKALQK